MATNSVLNESAPPGLFHERYRPLSGSYDEMVAADGHLRPHWQHFIAGLDAMAGAELSRRWHAAGRLLHENGLTYTVTAVSEGSDRPWALDFVPLVLDATEWRALEAGLRQRARLLNMVLADLYGEQRLVRDGHLPAALLFANPHFLRQCHGIRPKDGMFLHRYAADLGRSADGRWWVLADRSQSPSGIGYALENRVVLSRCLPELFRDCRVQRLAGFFQSSHDTLVERTGRENPRIVLLSPGSGTQGYFAHAYLAHYLGYSLVEGADLTVRGTRAYVAAVDGLKPVDLVLRQVDSEDCDPLELRNDSSLGVAGLLQAVRAGTVVIANALGSGLVETKALMRFLPALCRVLLDEELMLPSPTTWWCGEDDARRHVLDAFDGLAIEHAFQRRPMLATQPGPSLGAELADYKRDALIARIENRGHDYVAQEPFRLGTTPSWVDGSLQPRLMALRVFLAACKDDYSVMPGGLTRVAPPDDARAISLSRAEGTKDTWILADGPVATLTLLRSPLSYIEPKRTGKDLPSRAADNLFWLGRYAERAENTVRGLRSVVRRLTEDVSPINDATAMVRVLHVLLKGGGGTPAASTASGQPLQGLEPRLQALLLDSGCAYGLQETVSHLQRTAALVRDRLSLDAWRTLQHFHSEIRNFALHGQWLGSLLDLREALDVLDKGVRSLAAFSGLEMENMTRNFGWRFVDMGRRLERAQHSAELLRTLLRRGAPDEDGSLILLLELADSFMTYRSRYLTTPMLPPVLDLLLLDETNPRSIAFQIAALAEHVERLPRDDDVSVRSTEQKITLALLTDIRLAEIARLCEQDADGRRRAFEQLLKQIATALPRLSETITRNYFSHAEARRPADL